MDVILTRSRRRARECRPRWRTRARSSRTTAPAPMTAPSPIVTPSRIFAPAPIQTPSPIATPADVRVCSSTVLDGIGEIVVAADDVAVGRHQHALAPIVTRLAENTSQLKPRFAPSASSMSPFLHDRIVLRPMNTPSPMRMPRFDSPFASIRQLSSIDDVAADVDLVRVTQDDVLAEDDVAAARPQQHRVQRLAEHQPQRARATTARTSRSARSFSSAPEPGPADDERRVLRAARRAGREQLLLGFADRQLCGVRRFTSHPSVRYQSRVRRMPSRSPTRGANPISVRARVMSNARLLVKKSTRRRKIGGSMPNGAQIASQTAPAVQNGQTGKCRVGGAHAGDVGHQRDQRVQRRHFSARRECRCGSPPPGASRTGGSRRPRSSMNVRW